MKMIYRCRRLGEGFLSLARGTEISVLSESGEKCEEANRVHAESPAEG